MTSSTRGTASHASDSERERLMTLFSGLVEPLSRALPISSEVVLHDLGKLPDSIVAVHGDVTGRRVGDPATDILLEQASTGEFQDMVGYRTKLMDGRAMRSTTMIVRTSDGAAVAALCINSDVSVWESVERIAAAMSGSRAASPAEGLADRPDEPAPEAGPGEVFARDVDELASHLIHQAIRAQGVPVDLMRKDHKLAVVRDLKARGMFLLRDAVEMIATSLGVTRFTIYNYLNEIGEEENATHTDRAEARPVRRKASE